MSQNGVICRRGTCVNNEFRCALLTTVDVMDEMVNKTVNKWHSLKSHNDSLVIDLSDIIFLKPLKCKIHQGSHLYSPLQTLCCTRPCRPLVTRERAGRLSDISLGQHRISVMELGTEQARLCMECMLSAHRVTKITFCCLPHSIIPFFSSLAESSAGA